MDHKDKQPKEDKPITPQDFEKEYEKLCEKMGLRMIAEPFFIPTNHQTFELGIKYKIIRNQKRPF